MQVRLDSNVSTSKEQGRQLLKRFIPAIVAIAITYLIFVALVAAMIFIVVPPLIDQARDLIVSVPGLVRRLTDAIANPNNRLFSKLPGDVRRYIVGLPDQAVQFLSTYGIVDAQRTFNVPAMLRVLKVHFAPAPSPEEMVTLELRAKTLTLPK